MLKNLSIDQQVEFINKEIDKGTSIKAIANKYYGIKTESGLRKKLNRQGYFRNGARTHYIKKDDELKTDKTDGQGNEIIKKDNNSKRTRTQMHTQKSPITNIDKSMHTQKGDKKGVDVNLPMLDLKNNDDFLEVIKRIDILERKFNKFGCGMGDNAHPSDYIEENTLKTYISSNKVIKKSIFLYPEVWEMLDEVTELFPHSSKQSIYNSLLVEVLEKYLKLYKNSDE